ncbi:FAD-binding oxidoreductase [Mesorhizobium sp.]|uniref:NAD(P)/FAD-dependent oxidoreductase n=1 Tax=Mesorhizobium sp. TaxID=1871066 RepID=UPI0025BDA72D|nr:FAD-binding oxidoreductase [Mesorhizobium sp.]
MANTATPKTYDVGIIGAGIAGCSTAFYLARRGVRVAVFDRGPVAGEQSSRAWGFIRKQGRHPAEIPLAAEASVLWDEITEEFGFESTQRVKSGILMPAETTEDEEVVETSYADAQTHGLTSEILDARALKRKLPELAGNWRCALFTRDDGHGDSKLSTLTLARAAKAAGAEFFNNEVVIGFTRSSDRVSGIRTLRNTYQCAKMVVASGIGSRSLLARLGYNLPVQNIRSSVGLTTATTPFTQIAMWAPTTAYRPRPDGSFIIGNGYRNAGTDYDLTLQAFTNLRYFLPALKQNQGLLRIGVGRDTIRSLRDLLPGKGKHSPLSEPATNIAKVKQNLAEFCALFPHINDLRLADSWAGRIDTTPDLIPVIDRLAGYDNVYALCGFSGHGFALGPVVGKQMSNWIIDGAPALDLSKFKSSRFADGDYEIIKAA